MQTTHGTDWVTILAAFAAVVAAVAAIVGLVFLWGQVRAAKRVMQAQTMLGLMLELQSEESVNSRRLLYHLYRSSITGYAMMPYADRIEPALRTFDTIGVMAKNDLLPKKDLLDAWGGMIERCWRYSEEFVRARREREGRDDLWKNFEELAISSTAVPRKLKLVATGCLVRALGWLGYQVELSERQRSPTLPTVAPPGRRPTGGSGPAPA